MQKWQFAALGLTISVGFATFSRSPVAARGQVAEERGWVEGTIVNGAGIPPRSPRLVGTNITLRPQSGNGVYTEIDRSKGGFFTLRDLKPGVYEVFVDDSVGYVKSGNTEEEVKYRPIHMFGLLVEPGKRTLLNIVVKEGTELEERSKPVVPTQKALIISEELEKLQRQINELKKP